MNNLSKRRQHIQMCSKYLARSYNTTIISEQRKEKFSYEEFMSKRQIEATRSIVVQVSSNKSFPELYNYCNSFGNIVGAHHYTTRHEDELHYILLEFSSMQEAAAAIDSSANNEELTGVPVRSPFLWFKAAGKRTVQTVIKSTTALNIIEGTNTLNNRELNEVLLKASTIENQIYELHQRTQLNDLGVRLRFLAALQVQQALTGMFPAANTQPFGSSVNGFGKMGCDLDLILRFDREVASEAIRRKESRLVFHTKDNLNNGRSQTQRQMESIGDMLHLFLPGVCNVRRILQARVPIIKYNHEHLNLEVDLSMSNLTGFYMSELLYMFGEYDERVRPLTFCIRHWANTCGLTNPSPGRWITNFSLTCLVIFFLQQMKDPVLPTINMLTKSASQDDVRITENGINCTFARDLLRIGFHCRNTNKISELLLNFFEFYSQFDFNNKAISLNEGRAITKPDHSALYITNPLEQGLNVSKNVSLEECERFRIEIRNAAWMLEFQIDHHIISDQEHLEAPWGLLNIFKASEKVLIRPNMFFKPRMVEVSDLFDKSGSPTPATTHINFKDAKVKKEVQTIKTQARSDLKQLRISASMSATVTPLKTKGRRGR